MRSARVKLKGKATYHCMSRIIQRQMLLGEQEKEKFRVLMRGWEEFCGVRILTYAILTNHFHLLVEVPDRREISDHELVRRVRKVYSKTFTRELECTLNAYRQAGQHDRADALKTTFTYRMYDISEFMKTLKQRFTQWYNRKNDRQGTLWEERFKSVLLEGRVNALRIMAAYIDLNPVRAGLVEDPKDYRYCGYAEAVAGDAMACAGLGVVMKDVVPDGDWPRVASVYRQTVYERGVTTTKRKGIDPAKVREVLSGSGELSQGDLLLCRVRYFSDGLVLGSREFVDSVLRIHRSACGSNLSSGARKMRHGEWGDLHTMRALRETVIAAPA